MSNIEELDDDLPPEEEGAESEAAHEGAAQEGAEAENEHEHEGDEHEESARRDTELEQAADDSEREAIRERRRLERRNKNQRQKAKIDGLERKLNMVLEQNARLEQRVAGVQNAALGQALQSVDAQIAHAQNQLKQLSKIEADALSKNDGNSAVQARDAKMAWQGRIGQLEALKANASQGAARPQQQALNPEAHIKARAFAQKNPWYRGPQSPDMDSVVLSQLDAALAREGFDPSSDAYWDELEERKKRYLPHRSAEQGQTERPDKPRSPVAGSNTGKTPSPKGSFRLSPERVAAMKEAGAWNDTKLRQKYIDSYRKFDQENATR